MTGRVARSSVITMYCETIKDVSGRDNRSDSDTVYTVYMSHDCVRYTSGRHDGHASVLELETMLETSIETMLETRSLGLLRLRNSRTSLHTQRSTCPEVRLLADSDSRRERQGRAYGYGAALPPAPLPAAERRDGARRLGAGGSSPITAPITAPITGGSSPSVRARFLASASC